MCDNQNNNNQQQTNESWIEKQGDYRTDSGLPPTPQDYQMPPVKEPNNNKQSEQ